MLSTILVNKGLYIITASLSRRQILYHDCWTSQLCMERQSTHTQTHTYIDTHMYTNVSTHMCIFNSPTGLE